MSDVFIAWGNLQQTYPFHLQPPLVYSDANSQKTLLPKVKQQRQVAYFLLWEILQKIGCENLFFQGISKDENGRPYLISSGIDFNFSHSGEWVAVIVTKQSAAQEVVAIDIEQPSKKRSFERLLGYYAQKEELQWWQQQDDQATAFYLSWCAREAILKAKGRGIGAISKVTFQPQQATFITSDAPNGLLRFCQSLPFYLACFVEQFSAEQFYCYQWSDETLQKVHLSFSDYCVVNRELS
ncbi:4'-phosphopantetheinyl transferase family protein [Gallibacterium trehalosifermentans]|uniref:4'-phosphopantetheinyl transferase family protein n=1 Tax=Gallibacterium trehalosifermentans TaxID=516935 RepID=A0ABV6H051_9PAST